MKVLHLNTKIEGYSVDQCNNTMTVGELMSYLSDYDEDTPIYFKNDKGYTYGSLRCWDIEEDDIEEEEEDCESDED